MNLSKNYQYLDLDTYTPDDRLKRRQYIKNLALQEPVMLYRMAYGGSVWTLNFIWKVQKQDSQERTSQNALNINKINAFLPKFSTRSMQRDFLNRYSKHVNIPKSLLRSMFFEPTGCESMADSNEQASIDERISILLNSDHHTLRPDYRSWWRHWHQVWRFLWRDRKVFWWTDAFIETWIDTISSRLPDETAILSTETLRLKFQPNVTLKKICI